VWAVVRELQLLLSWIEYCFRRLYSHESVRETPEKSIRLRRVFWTQTAMIPNRFDGAVPLILAFLGVLTLSPSFVHAFGSPAARRQTSTNVVEQGKFRLHKFEQPIGEQEYEIKREGNSLKVKIDFKFTDRGMEVPLSAPSDQVTIESRGQDILTINGNNETLDRYTLKGLIWGRETSGSTLTKT